jgi:hypothetical protein
MEDFGDELGDVGHQRLGTPVQDDDDVVVDIRISPTED